MSFWMVCLVGRRMGALDGVEIAEGKEAIRGVNVRHSIVTSGGTLWRGYSLP